MEKPKSTMKEIELPNNALDFDPMDKRLNAYRKDLADERLRGKVEARSFIQGVKARIAAPVANVYIKPPRKRPTKAELTNKECITNPVHIGAETQLLYGSEVFVFARNRGYAWIQAVQDSYVGYVKEKVLLNNDIAVMTEKATHKVIVPRTFLYSEADLRSSPTKALSMGSHLTIVGEEERRGTNYALLNTGEAIIARHIEKVNCFVDDYVSVAEDLLHTPYLWGGTSAFGIDCSGLVQLALLMTGRRVFRDADLQAVTIGTVLKDAEKLDKLQRGDLVFWRGHVAIMVDRRHIIHANGATMSVSIEPLREAIDRIAPMHGEPLVYRRP